MVEYFIELLGIDKFLTGAVSGDELKHSKPSKDIFFAALARVAVQERQVLIMHELDHRAKNMLAVVMGLATRTAKTACSVEQFIPEYLSRLTSISRAYGVLTSDHWEPATLSSLVDEVLGLISHPRHHSLQSQGRICSFHQKWPSGWG